jgi:aminoglycoside phosphotransferase family enzyme
MDEPTPHRTAAGPPALEATVQALREPATYPIPVARVDAIETHMSWVFLTEHHAYKLKKPMRMPSFDHTTLLARRSACEVELELNRRLAGDVYLAVVPLVASREGLRLETDGEPVDWLVKMRRLPRDCMLDDRIERGAVQARDIDNLAEHLAKFYRAATPCPMNGYAYRQRLTRDIKDKQRCLEDPRYGLARDAIGALVHKQLQWLEVHASLLEARGPHVLDAHGDLRPEHVCLEPQPCVIDCLEFARELRLLDPLSELSFLALECRRLGATWIGERLIERYATLGGDRVCPALLEFYQSYHALVRATVAVWHLDDGAVLRTDHFRERAATYLRIAFPTERHTDRPA